MSWMGPWLAICRSTTRLRSQLAVSSKPAGAALMLHIRRCRSAAFPALMMPQPPCSRLVRWHVHRVVDNIYMRIFGLLLVIIDVILVFVRLGETGWKLNSDADPPVRTGGPHSSCCVIPAVPRALRLHPRALSSTLWLSCWHGCLQSGTPWLRGELWSLRSFTVLLQPEALL